MSISQNYFSVIPDLIRNPEFDLFTGFPLSRE